VRAQRFFQAHALGQADVAVSNVKGPERTVHICGCPIEQIVGFLPNPNGCPLGVAVTSYRGQLQLSVNADAGAFGPFGGAASTGAEVFLGRVENKLHGLAAAGRIAAAETALAPASGAVGSGLAK